MAYFDADDDDVIGARNIYKALEEAEYVQGRSFDMIKEQLDRDGIVAANILLNQTEYYYCLTALDNYDMTLVRVREYKNMRGILMSLPTNLPTNGLKRPEMQKKRIT